MARRTLLTEQIRPRLDEEPVTMARDDRHPDPTDTDEMGSAGHETGIDEPSATGTAGLYATPVHEEGEEAAEEGKRKAKDASR